MMVMMMVVVMMTLLLLLQCLKVKQNSVKQWDIVFKLTTNTNNRKGYYVNNFGFSTDCCDK